MLTKIQGIFEMNKMFNKNIALEARFFHLKQFL